MPRFDVEALEKFTVRTVYRGVEAPNRHVAEVRCQNGAVAYDEKTIEEGGEQWLETVSIEECPPRNIFDDNPEPCLSDDCELPHCRLCGRHMLEHTSPLICEVCREKATGRAQLTEADQKAWNAAVRSS